jgi:hypothetical protein
MFSPEQQLLRQIEAGLLMLTDDEQFCRRFALRLRALWCAGPSNPYAGLLPF